MTPSFAAVLFDMDGTLIDSEPHWMAAETALVARFGGNWTHADALSVVGSDLRDCAEVLRSHGVDLSVDEVVESLVDAVASELRRSLPWQPGALDLLAACRAAGVKTALVTMSYAPLAQELVVGAPAGTFDAVVTGDQVQRGKPAPDPYLLAAQRLGVAARDCLAIEDSPTGVRSAMASGAVTIAVPHVAAVPPAVGLSRVASLTGLTINTLQAIFDGTVIDELLHTDADAVTANAR